MSVRENSRGKCENTVIQSSEFAAPVSVRVNEYASRLPDGPATRVAPFPTGSSRTPTLSRTSTE